MLETGPLQPSACHIAIASWVTGVSCRSGQLTRCWNALSGLVVMQPPAWSNAGASAAYRISLLVNCALSSQGVDPFGLTNRQGTRPARPLKRMPLTCCLAALSAPRASA